MERAVHIDKVGQALGASPDTAFISGSTSGTPGTRTDHAHGLSGTPSIVIPFPTAADDDVDNAELVAFVKADGTNITVKSDAATVGFKALCIL